MSTRPLGRDIAAVLALKLALLGLLYILFFRPDQRPVVDGSQAAAHLLSPSISGASP